MPTLLMLCALTACASTPTQTGPPAASGPNTPSASKAYVTGSRIAVPVDSRTGLPVANPAQQQVNADDIALTGGQSDEAAALRRLVPEVH